MIIKRFVRCYTTESPLRRLLDGAATFADRAAPADKDDHHWATEPYARAPATGLPRLEPADHTVLLFPGAEQHYLGMGRRLLDVPAAKDLYGYASDVLQMNVARLCTEGPPELLARHADECVLATSLATLEKLREERPETLHRLCAIAGYRLGQLTALAVAGAISVRDALRMAALRSAALDAARRAEPERLLLLRLHPAARGLPSGARIESYLHAGCRLVSGSERAMRELESEPARWGVARCERIGVSAGERALATAEDVLRKGARGVTTSAPAVRVMCSNGHWLGGEGRVRGALWRLRSPTRWETAMHAMFARPRGERFPRAYCVGPGRWTRSSLREVNARAWDDSVQVDA